jgi:hypothetical protein
MIDNNEADGFIKGVWSEQVLVVTEDYEIVGKIFLPKINKRNRVLSDLLNGKKRFMAIKNCKIKHRHYPERSTEEQDFIQLNVNAIIMLRPIFDEKQD